MPRCISAIDRFGRDELSIMRNTDIPPQLQPLVELLKRYSATPSNGARTSPERLTMAVTGLRERGSPCDRNPARNDHFGIVYSDSRPAVTS
jgi:hypothetical protein